MTVRYKVIFTNFQARPVLLRRKKKGIHGKYIITKSMVHEFFCEVLTKLATLIIAGKVWWFNFNLYFVLGYYFLSLFLLWYYKDDFELNMKFKP